MKLLHLSDLHLGRTLGGVSLLEDQRDILTQILSLIDTVRPDAVLVAGRLAVKNGETTGVKAGTLIRK